jgi:hypothetical protein
MFTVPSAHGTLHDGSELRGALDRRFRARGDDRRRNTARKAFFANSRSSTRASHAAADSPWSGSMRMSSGPSFAKLNPRSG